MDYEKFKHIEENLQYIYNMRPPFKGGAIFSDTSAEYINPAEPAPYDIVSIRFRSRKNNLDGVFFVYNKKRYYMNKVESTEEFDFYEYKLQLEDETVSYYFEFHSGALAGYYDKRGLVREPNDYFNFTIIPGFSTPKWAKGAVMYQIYVDRFYNGDETNDVETNEYAYIGQHVRHVDDWSRYPGDMDVRDFYGGDLQGVIDKLDYLKDLGVEVIYFNPLFVSPSNHKYDIQDYDYIDPHIGKIVDDGGELLNDNDMDNTHASKYINRVTNRKNLEASNELFIKLVETAHQKGMRIILDGVFNHCGSFNKWMDRERIYSNAEGYEKGAYVSAESPYRGFFDFRDKNAWPNNSSYDGWWGHDTLPKLNYEESAQLYEYILRIAKKWVSPPFNADGWRLDVAADLGHSPEINHKFWQDFRKAVKEANPEAIIIAEHYGNTRDWLNGKEWDTVMNYDAFMEPVTWFLTGMEKHSDDYIPDLCGKADNFWGAMRQHGADFSMPTWEVAMNQLSNHDHSRFLTRTNHMVGRAATLGAQRASENISLATFRIAVMMQMTWVGAPTIYYGDEAGLCGFTDPDNRRTYPWGSENKELIEYHKDLIRIRKENPEIKNGSIKYVESGKNYLAYARFTRKEQSLILINSSDVEMFKTISVVDIGVPRSGKMKSLIQTTETGYNITTEIHAVQAGKVDVLLPKNSATIIKHFYEGKNRRSIG